MLTRSQYQDIVDLASRVVEQCDINIDTSEDQIISYVTKLAAKHNMQCKPELVAKFILLDKKEVIPYEVLITFTALLACMLAIK